MSRERKHLAATGKSKHPTFALPVFEIGCCGMGTQSVPGRSANRAFRSAGGLGASFEIARAKRYGRWTLASSGRRCAREAEEISRFIRRAENALSCEAAEKEATSPLISTCGFRRCGGRVNDAGADRHFSGMDWAIIRHKTAAFQHAAASSRGTNAWISRRIRPSGAWRNEKFAQQYKSPRGEI